MGKAVIDVSCALMADLLSLPPNVAVVQAVLPKWADSIRLVIEGPDLPELLEAADPPLMSIYQLRGER